MDVLEDAELVPSLITILYPIPSETPASYERILDLLAAALKYDMGAFQSSICVEITSRPPSALDGAHVFRAYVITSRNELTPEKEMIALLILDQPMTFEHLGDELRLFEGWALGELALARFGSPAETASFHADTGLSALVLVTHGTTSLGIHRHCLYGCTTFSHHRSKS